MKSSEMERYTFAECAGILPPDRSRTSGQILGEPAGPPLLQDLPDEVSIRGLVPRSALLAPSMKCDFAIESSGADSWAPAFPMPHQPTSPTRRNRCGKD